MNLLNFNPFSSWRARLPTRRLHSRSLQPHHLCTGVVPDIVLVSSGNNSYITHGTTNRSRTFRVERDFIIIFFPFYKILRIGNTFRYIERQLFRRWISSRPSKTILCAVCARAFYVPPRYFYEFPARPNKRVPKRVTHFGHKPLWHIIAIRRLRVHCFPRTVWRFVGLFPTLVVGHNPTVFVCFSTIWQADKCWARSLLLLLLFRNSTTSTNIIHVTWLA